MSRVALIIGAAAIVLVSILWLISAFQKDQLNRGRTDKAGGASSLQPFGALRAAPTSAPEFTPQPIPTAPSWEQVTNIPLYPDAQQVHDSLAPLFTRRYLTYRTSDPEEKVLTYYRDYLTTHGWTIDGPSRIHKYKWTDADGTIPWGLTLELYTTVQATGGTDVNLWIGRWPNTDSIPIYPGAEQIVVSSVPPPPGDEGEMDVRITTYVTGAKPEEIESYYKSVLPQHAWLFNEEESQAIGEAPGIIFNHWYGTMPSPQGANLYIHAQSLNSTSETGGSRTKVELRLENFDYGYHR